MRTAWQRQAKKHCQQHTWFDIQIEQTTYPEFQLRNRRPVRMSDFTFILFFILKKKILLPVISGEWEGSTTILLLGRKLSFQLLPFKILVQWFNFITACALLFVFSYTMSGISLFLPTRQKRSTSLPSKVKEKLCCLPRQNRNVFVPNSDEGVSILEGWRGPPISSPPFLFLQWLMFVTALALLVCPFFYYIRDQSISPQKPVK